MLTSNFHTNSLQHTRPYGLCVTLLAGWGQWAIDGATVAVPFPPSKSFPKLDFWKEKKKNPLKQLSAVIGCILIVWALKLAGHRTEVSLLESGLAAHI